MSAAGIGCWIVGESKLFNPGGICCLNLFMAVDWPGLAVHIYTMKMDKTKNKRRDDKENYDSLLFWGSLVLVVNRLYLLHLSFCSIALSETVIKCHIICDKNSGHNYEHNTQAVTSLKGWRHLQHWTHAGWLHRGSGHYGFNHFFCIWTLLSHKRAPEGFVMPKLCLWHSPAQKLSAAVSPCQATAGRGRQHEGTSDTHKQEHTTV